MEKTRKAATVLEGPDESNLARSAGFSVFKRLRPGWDDRKDFPFGSNGLNAHRLFLRRLLEVPLAEGETRAGLEVAFEPQGFLGNDQDNPDRPSFEPTSSLDGIVD